MSFENLSLSLQINTANKNSNAATYPNKTKNIKTSNKVERFNSANNNNNNNNNNNSNNSANNNNNSN